MSHWKEHPATNRQLKALRLFGVPVTLGITKGQAAGHITRIFTDPRHRERWNKYVFVTGDTDSDSADLKPFDPAQLERITLPENWEKKVSGKLASSFHARAESIWAEASPYDDPELPVVFGERRFCFTGKFEYGSRKACHAAIEQVGGIADLDVDHGTHYLVIGKLGSERFAKEGYGRKIEWAIVAKFERGTLRLISEDHWAMSLQSDSTAESAK